MNLPDAVGAGRKLEGGKYQLIELAGRGGMSLVWRARQLGPGRFERIVAIKEGYDHLMAQKQYREMFLEEARIAALLQDSNLAQVHDFIADGDKLYLVMEWVDGIDLATYIRYVFGHLREQTRWELMVAVGIGMLRGLAAAHERRGPSGEPSPVVHRDVSPHNILISVDGPAKLIDFGLCLAADRVGEATQPGMAKGKLAFLSPEVLRGARPTAESDQFAAGSVLWEMLVGRRLFHGPTTAKAYQRLANGEVEPLTRHRKDLPASLVAVVDRALRLDPCERFDSAREMARELGETLKESTFKEDLYGALAATVRQARIDLKIGTRTQGQAAETPIPMLESGVVELLDDEQAGGVLSWIPSLIKRLRSKSDSD